MVADFVLTRVEFNYPNDVLHWAPDGSIAINTSSQLTLLTPTYTNNDTVDSSNKLFHVNKIDIEKLPTNQLFQSRLHNEKTSTLFSNADTSIVKLSWSPLVSNVSILAILTNHRSLILLKNGAFWKDLTIDSFETDQSQFDDNLVYSFEWIKREDNVFLVIGTASGSIKHFNLSSFNLTDVASLKNSAILDLKTFDENLYATTSKNEIVSIDLANKKEDLIKKQDRFLIYDLHADSENIYYTTYNKVTKIDLANPQNIQELSTGLLSFTKISIQDSNIVLISNNKSLKINEKFQIVQDDIVEPILTKRLKKWNSKFNDFNTKHYSVNVLGSDTNHNSNILAVLYEIKENEGFRYKIASENLYKISFIPLPTSRKSNILANSLAVFQEYKLTGKFNLPEFTQIENINFDQPLDIFLKESVLLNPTIQLNSTSNIIERDRDNIIRKKYAEILVKYVQHNNLNLSNQIDLIVYNSLLLITGDKAAFEKDGDDYTIEFQTEAFKEIFTFNKNFDLDVVTSQSGHIWQRCSLSFLPILTPNVKFDPVTEKRIIDITKDQRNNYGEFTRAILGLNEVSLYSGFNFETK